MKKPLVDGVAISHILYSGQETKKNLSHSTQKRKRKNKLYASRCADDKVPFIQIRRES